MANLPKLMKHVINKIRNHRFLNSASAGIGVAVIRAQEKFINVQETVKKYNEEERKSENNAETKINKTIIKKLVAYMHLYEKLTKLDVVQMSKEHVDTVQNRLFECQKKRRELTVEVSNINDKLKNIYAELVTTNREDAKFVQLTIHENETLRKQTKLFEELKLLENEEKEYFTQLAVAIKEYNDNQTISVQKSKYLSVLVALISIIATTIYNRSRTRDIKKVVSNVQEITENRFYTSIHELERELERKFEPKFAELQQELQKATKALTSKNQKASTNVNTGWRGTFDSTVNFIKDSSQILSAAGVVLVVLKLFGL